MTIEEYAFAWKLNGTDLSGIVTLTNPPQLICYCDEEQSKIILAALNKSLPPAGGAEAFIRAKIADHKLHECYPTFVPELAQVMTEFAAQQQPTAEGAEEITAKHRLRYEGYFPGFNFTIEQVADLMDRFATIHAQRIADKMVSERYDAFIRWIVASEVVLFNGRWNILNMESMDTQELYRYWVSLQKPVSHE